MDKVGSAMGDLAGGGGCCYGCHEDTNGGSLLLLGRGVLVSEVPEHAGEALVEIL